MLRAFRRQYGIRLPVAIANSDRFGIGDVLRTAVAVYGRNVVALLGLAALAAGPPVLWLWLLDAGYIPYPDVISAEAAAVLIAAPTALLPPICGYWLQTGVTYLVIRNLRGGRATFHAAAAQGARGMVHATVASVLTGVVVGVGMLLLIVPGVVLFLMLWVVLPVAVVERRFASALARSHELTRGHKWSLLGLVFLLIVAYMLVYAVATPVALQTPNPQSHAILVFMLANMIGLSIWGTVVTVAYHNLRIIKEGDGTAVARVFD